MPPKIEIYAIALVMLALAFVGAYYKGRHDESGVIANKQEIANSAAYQAELKAAADRTAADNAARDATNAFINQVSNNYAALNKKFASLPNVITDTRGCPSISPNFVLHWNAAAGVPTGSTDDKTSDSAHSSMSNTGMPTP